MELDPMRSLDRLAVEDRVDATWLCRAGRALEELDESLTSAGREADGRRLRDRARSLRRRLVLATKDARIGAELKAELTSLACDAGTYFRRVRRLSYDSQVVA
jgi:hypothetical protein